MVTAIAMSCRPTLAMKLKQPIVCLLNALAAQVHGKLYFVVV